MSIMGVAHRGSAAVDEATHDLNGLLNPLADCLRRHWLLKTEKKLCMHAADKDCEEGGSQESTS